MANVDLQAELFRHCLLHFLRDSAKEDSMSLDAFGVPAGAAIVAATYVEIDEGVHHLVNKCTKIFQPSLVRPDPDVRVSLAIANATG